MKINPNIFKAYDIRGVYPTELNEEIAYKVGRSFANFVKKSPIIVGGDSRLSSPSLKSSIIKGLNDQGIDVIDMGLCSTSCFYFSTGNSEVAGGIMVTASHSSKEFNGFKMVLGCNIPLSKEQLSELKNLVLDGEFSTASIPGKSVKKDLSEDYIQAMKNTIKEKFKPLKVIMDAGNGTAGLYIEKIFDGTELNIIPLYFEPDGNFPNHETNPKIPENRVKLIEKIKAEKADLGFMFDGDADRVGIFDRNGDLVDFSLVMALISEYRVKNSDRKKVIVEVRTSKVVRDWVEKAGGSLEITECWTIPIKFKIKSDPNVIFGGETSGHYIFPELYATDDGIMGALTFIQAISAKQESIDEIIGSFKKNYFVLDETNFKMESMEKGNDIMNKLKEKYSLEGAKIVEIDGLSAIFPDWSFNLRKSQTDPVIRLNMEASSKEVFESKKQEITDQIEKNL